MKIASFNVNSIKARLPNLIEWLEAADPDLVLLQEIKCESNAFPVAAFSDLGFHSQCVGQKAYHGVAIVSKQPVTRRLDQLPGDAQDHQARYLEVELGSLIIASVYLPNGNPTGSDKFSYKLAWMERLHHHLECNLLPLERPVLLGGDFNLCPHDRDCYDPDGLRMDALLHPQSRKRWYKMIHLGLVDLFRALNPDREEAYSYWDYMKGRYVKNQGLRIDHFLASPEAADRIISCEIDPIPRGRDRPSDHTPIIVHYLPGM